MQIRPITAFRLHFLLASCQKPRPKRLDWLRQKALDAFRQDAESTLSFLVEKLHNSKKVRKSLVLLWLLKQIATYEPNSVETACLFRSLPGLRLLDRLHVCSAVLLHCLSPRVMGDHLDLVLHPRIDQLIIDAGPLGTQLRSRILNKQTDEVCLSWIRTQGIRIENNPYFVEELNTKLRSSAESGDSTAKYLLALQCPRNPAERLQLLHEAAGLGSLEALCALGVFYCIGEFVDQDRGRGEALLREAAGIGSPTAKIALDRLPPINDT